MREVIEILQADGRATPELGINYLDWASNGWPYVA